MPFDYQSLSEFRYQIRRFLRFSEEVARKAKIEPRQHQLLLAIKGLPANGRPSIGALAERLQLEHHSTVELANRLAKVGYIRRARDGNVKDRREVLLELTAKGETLLRRLSLDHHEELRIAGPALMVALLRVLKAGKRVRASGNRRDVKTSNS